MDGVWVGSGVSEVQAAFWATVAGYRGWHSGRADHPFRFARFPDGALRRQLLKSVPDRPGIGRTFRWYLQAREQRLNFTYNRWHA